ncbi:CHAP domain-containing protein, partial [Patescibacteria group bacterium]|nr:CHAP domain-containing protein [Patescibacteria group bacterium]
AVGERTTTFGKVPVDKDKPFSLKKINKGYDKVVENILNFEEAKQVNTFRDSNFDKVISSSAFAISNEIKEQRQLVEDALKNTAGKSKTEIDRLNFIKNTLDKKDGAAKWLELRSGAVFGMKKIDDALDKVTKGIKKSIVNVNRENKDDVFNMSSGKLWDGLDGALEIVRDKNTKQLNHLEQARTLYKNGEITKESFDSFERHMKEYGTRLTTLEKVLDNARNGRISRKEAVFQINRTNKNGAMVGGDIFQNSPHRKILKGMDHDLRAATPDGVADIINNDDLRSARVEFHGRKLIPLTARLRQEKITHSTEELFDAAWDGKFSERYIWNNRIKPQLNVFSPDTVASRILKRTNYLGLLVGEDFDPKKRFKSAAKAARWKRRHAHKFSMNLDKLDADFAKRWDLEGKTLNLIGGDHFKIIEKLEGFDLSKIDDQLILGRLISASGTSGISALIPDLLKRGIDDPDKFLAEFQELVSGYKDKMAQFAEILGIEDLNDSEFQAEFLKLLMAQHGDMADGYGILRNYVGRLDKLYIKLNNIGKAFRKTKLGKFIAGFNNLKTIIREKIATLVAEFITGLITGAAASTGVLAVVVAALKGVIKKVVEKTLILAEKVFKGLVNADFDAIFDALNENAQKAMIGCVLIMLPPTLFVSFIMYFIVMLFGVTIPIADPTIKSDEIPIELNMALTYDLTLEQLLALGSAILPDLNLNESEIAHLAYIIATHLIRGADGAFNATDIPFYYSDETKERIIGAYPDDPGMSKFWCTWLVAKAYDTIDPNFEMNPSYLSAKGMIQAFNKDGKDGYSYSKRDNIVISQINSGDVLFFSDPNDNTKGHVAIVYEVKTDTVVTLESNGAYISYNIGTDDNGHINKNTPYST